MRKLIYFLPAAVGAAFYGWLVLGLEVSVASIEPEALFSVQVLFVAGVLLCIGKWWGCLPGAAVGLALLWQNSRYRGHQHLDLERPVGVGLILFYLICGIIWLYRNRKNELEKHL